MTNSTVSTVRPCGIYPAERIVRLDNTAFDLLRTCPSKFMYRIVRNLTPLADDQAETPPLDLHDGAAWHTAMDAMYESRSLEAALIAWESASEGLADDPRGRKTIGRGVRDLRDYWERYQADIHATELIDSEIIATGRLEFEFADESWILEYVGALDKVLRMDARLRIRDHKRTGYINLYTGPSYELSNQLIGYAWLLREFYGRALDTSQPITADADIVGVTRVNPPSEFLRPEVEVDEDGLDEWETEIASTCQIILGRWASNIWPRFGRHACNAYNKMCMYFPICVTSRSMREIVIEAEFVERPWAPETRGDEIPRLNKGHSADSTTGFKLLGFVPRSQ